MKKLIRLFTQPNFGKLKVGFDRLFIVIASYIAFVPFANNCMFWIFLPNLSCKFQQPELPEFDPFGTYRFSGEIIKILWNIPNLLNYIPYTILILIAGIISFFLTYLVLQLILLIIFYILQGFSKASKEEE